MQDINDDIMILNETSLLNDDIKLDNRFKKYSNSLNNNDNSTNCQNSNKDSKNDWRLSDDRESVKSLGSMTLYDPKYSIDNDNFEKEKSQIQNKNYENNNLLNESLSNFYNIDNSIDINFKNVKVTNKMNTLDTNIDVNSSKFQPTLPSVDNLMFSPEDRNAKTNTHPIAKSSESVERINDF
jgi:hypothetical protein